MTSASPSSWDRREDAVNERAESASPRAIGFPRDFDHFHRRHSMLSGASSSPTESRSARQSTGSAPSATARSAPSRHAVYVERPPATTCGATSLTINSWTDECPGSARHRASDRADPTRQRSDWQPTRASPDSRVRRSGISVRTRQHRVLRPERGTSRRSGCWRLTSIGGVDPAIEWLIPPFPLLISDRRHDQEISRARRSYVRETHAFSRVACEFFWLVLNQIAGRAAGNPNRARAAVRIEIRLADAARNLAVMSARMTTGNSSPFALCTVISRTPSLPSSRIGASPAYRFELARAAPR